jgi:hypothetical protein
MDSSPLRDTYERDMDHIQHSLTKWLASMTIVSLRTLTQELYDAGRDEGNRAANRDGVCDAKYPQHFFPVIPQRIHSDDHDVWYSQWLTNVTTK